MPASNVPFDSFFQLPKRPPLGRPFGEQGSVHVIGCNLSRFSDNDPVAVLIPFEHGTGSYPEPATNLGRDGDLSLCGEPRLSQSHAWYITWVMYLRQGASVISLTEQEQCYERVEFEY
jgi:hypothetical protein